MQRATPGVQKLRTFWKTNAKIKCNAAIGYASDGPSQPLGKPATDESREMVASPTPKPSEDIAIPAPEAKPRKEHVVFDQFAELDSKRLALPFDSMPGPPILKYASMIWNYVPSLTSRFTPAVCAYFRSILSSSLAWNRGVGAFKHMFDKYGPIVRLRYPFGGDIVFVGRPEHFEKLYSEEGQHPIRGALSCLKHYHDRKTRGVAGSFITSGTEWEAVRKSIEIPFQKSVIQYQQEVSTICDDFITRTRAARDKQEEVFPDFGDEVFKWSIECMGLVAVGERLGCVDPNKMEPPPHCLALVEAIKDASDAVRQCESGFQMWKFVETPSDWSKLASACETIERVAARYLQAAQGRTELQQSARAQVGSRHTCVSVNSSALLDTLLLTELPPRHILTIILETLLIGTNAVSHALTYLLYHLARNPQAQKMLHKEVSEVLVTPQSSPDYRQLEKMTYLQACIKESLRMNPPMPVLMRILTKDTMLYKYLVPKGTCVLMVTHLSSLQEGVFDAPLEFRPERWLTDSESAHPFASIPFGHGARCCPGRGLAELQLGMLVSKMVRQFFIAYHYGELPSTTGFIALPKKPLMFRFLERSGH